MFLEDYQFWLDQALADPEIRRRVEFLERLSWESGTDEQPEQSLPSDPKEKTDMQTKSV